jgi:CubicO group peptidase (beta-lactamase class C family)
MPAAQARRRAARHEARRDRHEHEGCEQRDGARAVGERLEASGRDSSDDDTVMVLLLRLRARQRLPARGQARYCLEPETTPVPDRSVGYMRTPDGVQSNAATLPPRPTSAGGGYSTVGDLQRFASALLGHRLLSAKYTELLTTGQVDARGAKYAYGFFDMNEGGVRPFGHGGARPE